MTPAERAVWALLRGRGFRGLKFRRQERIDRWIVDFCCYELMLVIELDGGVHRLRVAEDAARDVDLRRRGFTVLRFGNEAVLRNPGVVLAAIASHAEGRPLIRQAPPDTFSHQGRRKSVRGRPPLSSRP